MGLIRNLQRGILRPEARDDAYTVGENEDGVVLDPLQNDAANNPPYLYARKIVYVDPGDFLGTIEVTDQDAHLTLTFGTAYDYLAEGESTTATIIYGMMNALGYRDRAEITLTINGANDGVTITDVDGGAILELTDEDAGEGTATLTDSGTISFDDPDLIDVHTATITGSSSTNGAVLGSLVLDPVSDDAMSSAGSVGWTYSVDDGLLQELAEGETITETFTVEVDDGHGGTDSTDVVVVITGTNDAPEAGDDSGFTTAQEVAIDIDTADLLSNDSDVDNGASFDVVSVGNAINGTVSLVEGVVTFTPDDDFDSENDGTATFDYTIEDEYGATSTATVTVDVTDSEPGPSNPNGSAPGVSNVLLHEDAPAMVSTNLKVDFGADEIGSTALTSFNIPNITSATGLVAGGEVDSGLTAQGRAITFVLSADGTHLDAIADKDGADEELIFTVDLPQAPDTAGPAQATVELLGEIDHRPNTNAQSISFVVAAMDGDGDVYDASLSLRITDDGPGDVDNGIRYLNIDEPAPDSDTRALKVDFGADEFGSSAFTHVGATALVADGMTQTDSGLSSTGDTIWLTLSADGTVLTGATDSETIFVMELDQVDPGAGNVTFDLLGPVDQFTQYAAVLNLTVEATDYDGDSIATAVNVRIHDDEFFTHIEGFEGATNSFDNGYGVITLTVDPEDPGNTVALFEDDAVNDTGPFSRLGGYSSDFGEGYTSSVKIYIDPDALMAGEGFDLSTAANGSDGAHQRDFIFHVTDDTSDGVVYVGASNNTNFEPREDLETINHAEITDAGWYTFESVFYENGLGDLAVDMNVFDSNGTLVFTETRTDPSDDIATEVGGNRYMWFTNIDVDGGILVDDVTLAYNG